MSSDFPIVKQVQLPAMLFQVALLTLMTYGFYQVDKTNYLFYSMAVFIAVMVLLRRLVPRYHRKGISLYKRGNYAEAVPLFERSYRFFSEHAWVDKYRFITMLSSSRISYREMALLNMAFCLGQDGRKDEAVEMYNRVLSEFPGSRMAEAALRMLR